MSFDGTFLCVCLRCHPHSPLPEAHRREVPFDVVDRGRSDCLWCLQSRKKGPGNGTDPARQLQPSCVLDMLNAHRNGLSVEDVANLSTDTGADEVWQCWFPVRYHRDGLSVIPTESSQVLAKLPGR